MKSKGIVTKYTEICALCGRPATDEHHLIFGNGMKPLAEADGIKIPICRTCHTSSLLMVSRIHDNSAAEALSKMLGQVVWEKHYLAANVAYLADDAGLNHTTEQIEDEAREAFMKRYGRSYL